ncbi:MAG: LCP family protein [Chloroflexi bacterium]|nr:LCP family protein [Chloroflexota bacterium]
MSGSDSQDRSWSALLVAILTVLTPAVLLGYGFQSQPLPALPTVVQSVDVTATTGLDPYDSPLSPDDDAEIDAIRTGGASGEGTGGSGVALSVDGPMRDVPGRDDSTPLDVPEFGATSATTVLDAGSTPGSPLSSASTSRSPALSTPLAMVPTPTPGARLTLPTPTPAPREVWFRENTFNFVAVGVDRRTESEIPRTDTIMIGQVDLRSSRLTLVSIPRDLVVTIPGYGADRINTAYVYGELYHEPGGGIGLLKRTIERNFGVSIQHFGSIDFQCFRSTVDAVGGVMVDVPTQIVDSHYPTDDYGYQLVRFDPGPQTMDGERALQYARTRYADNDFHRMQRQQLIVAALRHRLLQISALPAIPSILSGCRNLQSDLGWRDYLALTTALRSFEDRSITLRTIDEQMAVEAVMPTGAAVLLPRWEPIRALVRDSFGSPAVVTRPVSSPVPGGPRARADRPVTQSPSEASAPEHARVAARAP